ncbi:MAG: hypothetical protein MI743_20225 [Sneathiellales bacterium]|nr:hypothetical protein [Sneathiellales bacterium]
MINTALTNLYQGLIQKNVVTDPSQGNEKQHTPFPVLSDQQPDQNVQITLSDEAKNALQTATSNTGLSDASFYEKFYPAREGFSSVNLAAAVADPSAQPYSQNRAFSDVAASARETLDTKYQQMMASGEPYGSIQSEGRDRNAAFGEFDRRALYAIASNEGGHFSKDEQNAAKSIMSQQQGNAMGFGSGPTRVAEEHVNPFLGDKAASFKAMNSFLDNVSAEERATSVEWAQQRAAGQRIYEDHARKQGEEPEPFNSDNALLNLFLEAFDSWNADEARFNDHFKRYEDRVDGAIAENTSLFALE